LPIAFYQVSTELAAKRQVDMERARNDLEEHKRVLGCSARASPNSVVTDALGPPAMKEVEGRKSKRRRIR
jgi:hypothetical protein